jgi:hypothetical protein
MERGVVGRASGGCRLIERTRWVREVLVGTDLRGVACRGFHGQACCEDPPEVGHEHDKHDEDRGDEGELDQRLP